MTRLIAILAAAVLGTSAIPAHADEKSETVGRLFNKLTVQLATKGLKPGGYFRQGRIAAGHSAFLKLHLAGGRKSEIVAMCDHDCSAMDMQLLDPRGGLVRGNDGTQDTPVVEAAPDLAGDFMIEVRMLKCDADPCSYGVETFVR